MTEHSSSLRPRVTGTRVISLLLLCCATVSCTDEGDKTGWIVPGEEGKLKLEVIADGISVPFGMAFLPDGQLLVTDRPAGKILRIDVDTRVTVVLEGVPQVVSRNIVAGLLDILPHPDFGRNHRVFFAYSAEDEQGVSLVVESATLTDDRLLERKRLFAARPYYDAYNFGGSRLLWQDGFLFITTGVDPAYQDSAQLLSNHLGKVLRIREDGSVPDDNPFVDVPGALPEIWCLGTRNAQGLAVNPSTQEIWAHEHGPKGGDEVNILRAGKNYGWPVITYGLEYDGTPVGEGMTRKEGMEQPLYYYVPSIAPSGMEFYTGRAFRSWTGNLFIGSLALQHLNRLVIQDGKVIHEERLLQDQQWRVRNVRQGPDGFLYIAVDGGMIIRIRPASLIDSVTDSLGRLLVSTEERSGPTPPSSRPQYRP